MQWSVVTWRSANPIRPAGARTPVVLPVFQVSWLCHITQNTGGTAEAVHPVFSRMLPQALSEASSGVSPSQRRRQGSRALARSREVAIATLGTIEVGCMIICNEKVLDCVVYLWSLIPCHSLAEVSPPSVRRRGPKVVAGR